MTEDEKRAQERIVSQAAEATEYFTQDELEAAAEEYRNANRGGYSLTLTKSERDAIDWVGGRYTNGNDLHDLLENAIDAIETQTDAWNDDTDITFRVPEAVAWSIHEMRDGNDGQWPCFSDDFTRKMNEFCDKIV